MNSRGPYPCDFVSSPGRWFWNSGRFLRPSTPSNRVWGGSMATLERNTGIEVDRRRATGPSNCCLMGGAGLSGSWGTASPLKGLSICCMAVMSPGTGFLPSNVLFKNQMKVTSSPVSTSYCKHLVNACGL